MIKNFAEVKKRLLTFLESKEDELTGDLKSLVNDFTKKNGTKILSFSKNKLTPFYLIDKCEIDKSCQNFLTVFRKHIPNLDAYYAVKSNYHPYLLKKIVQNGLGLDVSSGRELKLAIRAGAKKIIFSGPGKTKKELELALKNTDKIILHLDSFRELEKIGILSEEHQTKIKVGVRIFTKYHGFWNKFGIPLSQLSEFWQKSKQYPWVEIQGIQCHMSWNESSKPYQNILKLIASHLKDNFSKKNLNEIKFIDFGGGFTPYRLDGYYPWFTHKGAIFKGLNESDTKKIDFSEKYYLTKSVPLEEYAIGISKTIHKHLKPILPNCNYFSEPGKIISNNAMHIVLKVEDIKRKEVAILDGGYNILGWEKFKNGYAPLINLTNYSLKEIPFKMYGSLCQADDIWGYYCYASKIEEGDIIVVPYQGAYTYAYAQNFIKSVPKAYLFS